MKKLCLFVFIFCFSVLNVFAQSGRIKQESKTNTPPQIEGPISDAPPPRKGAVVSSPTGLKPKPDNLPRPVLANNSNAVGDIPDYVVYETVFRLAKIGWSAAEELKFHPEEVRVCRQYRVEKILNDKQEKILNEVSEETLLELEKLNQQAKPIIDEFRAKMRSGMIVQGGERPMPPPELEEIEQKKIKLIEGAIEKLKNRLGKKDFAGLNNFVN